MEWLTLAGAIVLKPLFENQHHDLVADWGHRIERVQVKTSTYSRHGRYEVALATCGGNQSWSGLVKRVGPTRIDALFVHVGDGRRWYIPAGALAGTRRIRVGGPKYAGYEIESGSRIAGRGGGEA